MRNAVGKNQKLRYKEQAFVLPFEGNGSFFLYN